MAEQLWFSDDRKTFFLIPPDADVPEGSLWLRTFDGSVRGFEPEALEPYAVDAETARPHVRAWMEGGYARAKQAFSRGYGDEPPVPPTLEDALGVDPVRLGSDPEALLEAAQHVGRGLKQWLDTEAPPEVASSVRSAAGALAQLIGALAKEVGSATEE